MELEGAAAALPARGHDVVTGEREQTGGVSVHVRVEIALDTAREEPDASDRSPACRNDLGHRRRRRDVVEQRLHRGESRQPAQQAARANERANARALVELERREGDAEPGGLGEDREHERFQEPMLRRRSASNS